MSDDVQITLTREEATVALLLVVLGTDAYTGNEPDFEAIDQLNRIPGKHMRSLDRKLQEIAHTVGDKPNGR